jgi:ribosomal protein L19
MATATALVRFEDLHPGDRLRVTQRVKVGFKVWSTEFTGTVKKIERRRTGLHVQRNFDDKVYADVILMARDVGQGVEGETTIVLDEFTRLEKV